MKDVPEVNSETNLSFEDTDNLFDSQRNEISENASKQGRQWMILQAEGATSMA